MGIIGEQIANWQRRLVGVSRAERLARGPRRRAELADGHHDECAGDDRAWRAGPRRRGAPVEVVMPR